MVQTLVDRRLVGDEPEADEDSDPGAEDDDIDEGSEDDDDDEDMLPIERQSKELAAAKVAEEESAQAEMEINIHDGEAFTLPTGEQLEEESTKPPDLIVVW